jgi:hypothetical protein
MVNNSNKTDFLTQTFYVNANDFQALNNGPTSLIARDGSMGGHITAGNGRYNMVLYPGVIDSTLGFSMDRFLPAISISFMMAESYQTNAVYAQVSSYSLLDTPAPKASLSNAAIKATPRLLKVQRIDNTDWMEIQMKYLRSD